MGEEFVGEDDYYPLLLFLIFCIVTFFNIFVNFKFRVKVNFMPGVNLLLQVVMFWVADLILGVSLDLNRFELGALLLVISANLLLNWNFPEVTYAIEKG